MAEIQELQSTANPMYGVSGLGQDVAAASNEYVSVSVSSNPMYSFVHEYGQESRDRSQGSTSESEREGITIPGRGPPIRTFKDRPASPNTATHSLQHVPERSSSESSSDGDPLRGVNGIDSPYSYARHTRNTRLKYTNSPNISRHEPFPIQEEQEDIDSGHETGRENSSSTISNSVKQISSNTYSQPKTPRYVSTHSQEGAVANSSSYQLYKHRSHSCDSCKGDIILVFVSLLTIVMSAVAIGLCVVLLMRDNGSVTVAPAATDEVDTSQLEQTTSPPATCNCSVPQNEQTQLPARLMQQLQEVRMEFQSLQEQNLPSHNTRELLQTLLARIRAIDVLIQEIKPRVTQPRTPELRGINLPLMFESNITTGCQHAVQGSGQGFQLEVGFMSITQTFATNYIENEQVVVNPHCEQSNGDKDFTTLQITTSSADNTNIIERLADTEIICLCYSPVVGGTCQLLYSLCPYQPVSLTTTLIT